MDACGRVRRRSAHDRAADDVCNQGAGRRGLSDRVRGLRMDPSAAGQRTPLHKHALQSGRVGKFARRLFGAGQMKFSLIMATLGRVEQPEVFLSSLQRQTWRDFEVVLVDQNPDARLAPLAERYSRCFPLIHLGSRPGLSRARNAALPYASGDIIGFPDDDCWYPPDLLERLHRLMESRPEIQGVSGRALADGGRPRGRWARRPALIGKYNIFGRCISFAIFLKRRLAERVGPFDETLGLGASTPWLGAEDYDYLL